MMIYDPYTGQQLRALRALPRFEPISGPWTGQPQTGWCDYAVLIGVLALIAAALFN